MASTDERFSPSRTIGVAYLLLSQCLLTLLGHPPLPSSPFFLTFSLERAKSVSTGFTSGFTPFTPLIQRYFQTQVLGSMGSSLFGPEIGVFTSWPMDCR